MSSPSAPASAPFGVLVLIAPADHLEATSVVFSALPAATLPVAVLLVPLGEGDELDSGVANLRRLFPWPVHAVEHGTVLAPGGVYIAPPHERLHIRPGLRCTLTPPDASPRPLDQLLASLALSAGSRALVVMFGGEDSDGVDGARVLRGVGGTILVQRAEKTIRTEQSRALTQAATLVLSPRSLGRVVADLLEVYPTGADHRLPTEAQATGQVSEAHYHALFTSMDEACAVVDVLRDEQGHWHDFRFVEVNPAFMEHTGMPYPEGQTATQLLGTPNPRWTQLYAQVVETGEPSRVEEPEFILGRVFDLNIFRLGGPDSHRVAVLFTDITARRQAEAALRESEERLRLAVDATGLGVYDWDLRTDVVVANARFREMFGLPTQGEIFGAALMETMVHPEEHAWVGARIAQAMEPDGSNRFEIEHRALTPDGERWLLTLGEVHFAGEGAERQAVRVVGNHLDITERRRNEVALQASEAKHRSLFETMGQGYTEGELLRGADGRAIDYRLLEMNSAFERLSGMDIERARGQLVSDVLPGLDPWWVETFDRVVRSGQPERLEREVPQLGRWYEVHAYPAAGDRFITLYDDVTARRRAELAAREQSTRQAFLLRLSDAVRPLVDAEQIQFLVVSSGRGGNAGAGGRVKVFCSGMQPEEFLRSVSSLESLLLPLLTSYGTVRLLNHGVTARGRDHLLVIDVNEPR